MRIGLISDTHVPEVGKEIPPQVFYAFQDVDLILHAGDIYSPSVLDALEGLAPVIAALGDDDYAKGDRRVSQEHLLELEGIRVHLVHVGPFHFTWGRWEIRANSTPAIREFAPDIVVFGHEHRAIVYRSNGRLYVNPGSPFLQNEKGKLKPYRRALGTVAILTIDSGSADARIIRLEQL